MKYFKISTNLLHTTFIIAIPVKDYAVAILILLLILLILILIPLKIVNGKPKLNTKDNPLQSRLVS